VIAVTHDPTFSQAADRLVHLIDGHLRPDIGAAA
jgi:hypothetical protein